ncbi:MAG: urea ABC transporter permease subunit UrtB [Alphaproteobacteria bacterium]|nr:MAG: urea ABC transporter permease subunit UrtB [Alphaproteobacteria bacterium]
MRDCYERCAALVVSLGLVLALLLAGALAANAESYEEALAKFAADSYNETDAAVAAVAASGNPLAAQVIEALQDGRLLFSAGDKKIYMRKPPAGLLDAATGQPVSGAEPAGLSPVRVNNRVRRAIDAALGSLTLLSADPVKRLEAAKAVFKSKDASVLATLDTAINKEGEARIKKALEEARAAILAGKRDAREADRLAAIAILRDRGDQDARSVLAGVPSDQPANIQKALADAITTIDDRLALWSVAQNFWYGISLGSVLLLAAIGLAITFGVMGVINMAHGEMVMLGAYTTFVVQELIRTMVPGLFDYSLAIAIPLAFLVAALVGMAIERGVIRFLYGRPLETLLATWGISLILQQAVRTSFGPTNREVGAPNFMSGAFELGGLTITWNRLWIIVFAGIIFAGLLAVLRYTELGLQMRAVTQNRRMASSMAINTGKIDAFTFALGSGIAGLAGVALSQIDNVSPNLGQSYIIDSFLVVVFGGVGNLWGTLVGAMSLGVANKFLEPYAGAVLGKIVLLVVVILFIQKRPRGLFALKGRAVEA